MWNWTIEASEEAMVDAGKIWELWSDVSSWPKWDHDLLWASLEGSFVEGAMGRLKPKGWVVSSFLITKVRSLEGFSDETAMPLTKAIFHHRLTPLDNGKIRITHSAEVRGLLAPLLRLTLGGKLAVGLPKAVRRLIEMAKNS